MANRVTDKVTAEGIIVIHPNDTEPLVFPFTKAIPSGATIASPSIVVVASGELAFGSVGVNSAVFNTRHDGDGTDIAASQAAVATPSGQVAATDYEVTVTVTVTSGSSSFNKSGVWTIQCRDT